MQKENTYSVLVRKPGGKRPLRRPRRMWEDDVKMCLREIEWGAMDWINLAQKPVEDSSGSIKCWETPE
jgi:hypothetical protein